MCLAYTIVCLKLVSGLTPTKCIHVYTYTIVQNPDLKLIAFVVFSKNLISLSCFTMFGSHKSGNSSSVLLLNCTTYNMHA